VAVLKWKIVDPSDANPATNTYNFMWNPSEMSSPFPERSVTVSSAVAPDGQSVLWEGATQPVQFTFRGTTPNATQYEALREWVYERRGRMYLYDHFGRRMLVVFKKFDPTPGAKARPGRYWYHSYTVTALVLAITAPTVGDGGYA